MNIMQESYNELRNGDACLNKRTIKKSVVIIRVNLRDKTDSCAIKRKEHLKKMSRLGIVQKICLQQKGKAT